MEFTCNRDNLVEALSVVQKAVPTRSPLPILECLLLDVSDALRITGNDTELGIEYELPAIIEELGTVAVNSKTFGDIIRKAPDVYVTIKTVQENEIEISSGNNKTKISTLKYDSYPKVNKIESGKDFQIEFAKIKDLIKQTIFAVSTDDSRPPLKGELVEIAENGITFVAIDGFKMAIKTIENRFSDSTSVIVPARILNEISKSSTALDDIVKISLNENQVMFSTSNFIMVSRLIKGEFLNYRPMVPREFRTSITVRTKDFTSAIERATLVMTDERKYPLLMNVYGNEIEITTAAEHGNDEETVNATVNGEDIRIGFNSRNLLEVLKAIDAENIDIHFTTNKGPCIIKNSVDENEFTYMVMPVLTRA